MNWIEWNLKLETLRKLEKEAYGIYQDAPEGMARMAAGMDWTHKQRAIDEHMENRPDMQ